MKRVPKWLFFVLAILVVGFSLTSLFGVYTRVGDNSSAIIKGIGDIRWGIDIRGGVEATFKPAGDFKASDDEMDSAKAIIETRLVANNITDYELYADYTNNRIIVRYPWKEDESNFNPEEAIKEISATAKLTFKKGEASTGEVLLEGKDIEKADVAVNTTTNEYVVSLTMTKDGTTKFAKATKENLNNVISIWMDDVLLSAPKVNVEITNGQAQIEGDFTADDATALATKINAGALPFTLETVSFGSVNPTLGSSSLSAMALAAVIALIIITILMISIYRLPGFIAVINLIGQMALAIAAISGFFPAFSSFTMTLPGIAGLILSIGVGVDANIITSERIKDELKMGKTLDTAISRGCKNSFFAILDGNMTIIFVSVILMLVFGPSNILSFLFGLSTTGAIYSFGYTLFIGVIANFIMGVCSSRLMLKSISGIKCFRSKVLYGGAGK